MRTKRDSCFYMANLGSEVSRAIASRDRGEIREMRQALDRGLNILERILALEEMNARRAEILILKNLLLNLDSLTARQSEHVKNYFYPFAARVLA